MVIVLKIWWLYTMITTHLGNHNGKDMVYEYEWYMNFRDAMNASLELWGVGVGVDFITSGDL